ncbi:helix-turn-helix domain-containing protein [Paenibacillus ginsengarvi]|uniref:Helix-turn-helix domain-containing protein n=1 Tax=Paenibacillus ginsengarvi TaxID=400777 RepID=A0A3B0BBL5_9BACL|nr:helix-turn-helix domain-containing protein [Paenibacillus ginsengarvi]RKN70685.1 helix-turn-helix domain-containing protein [Paenibacillus ginsengarvi]
MRTNSLFVKLLSGFIAVIVLLLSFNIVSYTFFYRNIRDEITTSSKQNLSHIVDRYENHIQSVQLSLVGLFFNNELNYLFDADRSVAGDAVNQLVKRIRDIRENDMLFLQDIIVQFQTNSFVVHQGGPDRLEALYANTYRSPEYGADFWRGLFQADFKLRLYPQAEFTNSQQLRQGEFFPLVLKSTTDENMYVAALLNADSMFRTFDSRTSGYFYILDEEGRVLFGSDRSRPFALAADRLDPDKDYVKADNSYYFYRKGGVTGLTYALVIPNAKIASQISRINVMLLVLLALALLVSAALSVFVSIRFYTPVQNIIETIQRHGPQAKLPDSKRIDELRFIDANVKQFLQTNLDISRDLRNQQSQLAHLGYIRKLKNIYTRPNELPTAEKPFYLVLFQLTMTGRFREMPAPEQERAMFFIKEFIGISLSESYPESVTLQTEKHQVLSLLFTEDEAKGVQGVLEKFKAVFDRDRQYGYLTVAFKPELVQPGRITEAYEETLEMAGRRKLLTETQLLTSLEPEPLYVGLSPAQEQELYANLQAGQAEHVMSLIDRALRRMEKDAATEEQFRAFAKEIVGKTVKALVAANVDIDTVLDRLSPYQDIKLCASTDEYRELFARLLSQAAGRIAERKEKKDPVVEFVLDSIHSKYHEDLSLERVASGLGLTPSYVSRYVKEKTGSNFSDYLNEVRIGKAKELLAKSNDPIREVATRVGYVNVTSFIRMFKKMTGLTPSDYRRSESGLHAEKSGNV